MPLTLSLLPYLALLGVAGAASAPARRRAALGLVPLALGLAGARRVLGDGTALAAANQATLRGTDPAFLLQNGVLLTLGAGLLVLAALADWRAVRSWRALPLALATAIAVTAVAPLLRLGRPPVQLALATGVAAVAFGAGALARRGVPVTWLAAWRRAPALPAWPVTSRAEGVTLFLVAVLAPLLVGSLGAVASLLGVAALLLAVLLHRRGAPRGQVVATSVVLPTVVAWMFARTLAGPEGLSYAALADGPFSPAAQVALVALAAPSAFLAAGLVPWSGLAPAGLLAPAALVFLTLAARVAWPDGMAHWRAALAGWAVLSALVAALRRRPAALAASFACFGAVTAEGASLPIVGLGYLAGLLAWLGWRRARPVPAFWRLAGTLGAGGALALLDATLAVETTWTVLLAGVAALAVASGPAPSAGPGSGGD